MTYASSPSSEYRLIQLEGVAEVEECLGVAALLDIVPGRRAEAAHVLVLPPILASSWSQPRPWGYLSEYTNILYH